ncbi:MFS general substrate transporter [Acephala macrosclerotiorum]|nr:MFS general substrate transporter [Acephala macrosclerotiorum]
MKESSSSVEPTKDIVNDVEDAAGVDIDLSLPMNWPLGKKIFNVAVPSLLGFVTSFGSSIYAPAVPDVMKAFDVSETIATVPLTTYVLGLAFGPMLSAPISEMFGRLGTYRFTVPISALFTLGAGFAPNITALCLLRFFAGFFGGAPLPVSAGTAADMFRAREFAIAGSILLYFPFLGPAIGPVVGGFATQHNRWKWSQYVLAIVMVSAWIPVFFLKETYLKIILARREQKVEAIEAREKQAKPPAKTLLFGILFITLLRPAKMLVSEPIVTFLSIYVAFGFAVIFTFFSSVPYVFGLVYHFDRGNTGLVFLSIALGCTLALPTCIILDRTKYQKEWKRTGGKVRPELRLWSAMYGAFGLPVSLFWFAWTARSDVHWIIPTVAMVPFAWGNLCIYVSTSLYLIDTYAALTAASAIAANGLLRYIFGGTFPLFTIQMYEKLGIGWTMSLLGFFSLVMLPIPWALYVLGPKIRGASHFETR